MAAGPDVPGGAVHHIIRYLIEGTRILPFSSGHSAITTVRKLLDDLVGDGEQLVGHLERVGCRNCVRSGCRPAVVVDNSKRPHRKAFDSAYDVPIHQLWRKAC
jgi:hypothetical protein